MAMPAVGPSGSAATAGVLQQWREVRSQVCCCWAGGTPAVCQRLPLHAPCMPGRTPVMHMACDQAHCTHLAVGVQKVSMSDGWLLGPPFCTAVAVTLYSVSGSRLLSWQTVWLGLGATGEQVVETQPDGTCQRRRVKASRRRAGLVALVVMTHTVSW